MTQKMTSKVTLLDPHHRFGDNSTLIPSHLSRKREYASKMVTRKTLETLVNPMVNAMA